jgi:hypothetical protein
MAEMMVAVVTIWLEVVAKMAVSGSVQIVTMVVAKLVVLALVEAVWLVKR